MSDKDGERQRSWPTRWASSIATTSGSSSSRIRRRIHFHPDAGGEKIARYLYGVRYHPRDVRFALAEASENRTSMTVERILLFCYHYDPSTNAYVLFASNFNVKAGRGEY